MLWDWIAYDYESGTRSPATDSEDARVQDAMFDALTRMLQSDNPDTQSAAIHGLGHLRHVNSTRAIGSFLSSQRELDASVRSDARDVLEDNFQ